MTLSADNRVSDIVTAPLPSRGTAWWPSLAGTPAGRFIGLTLLALLLAFLTVYPLSMLLYGSLHSTPPGAAGVFNLDGYRDIFTQRNLLVLLNTIGISLAKTAPSVITAVFLAWILAVLKENAGTKGIQVFGRLYCQVRTTGRTCAVHEIFESVFSGFILSKGQRRPWTRQGRPIYPISTAVG